jgi:L-asparaginase
LHAAQLSRTLSAMERPRVLVINTGGTIGMRREGAVYRPCAGHLAQLLLAMPELRSVPLPGIELHESDPLLDSSDMSPTAWGALAHLIAARDAAFDGFVILHGTDTMAYTASALSFMLEGLQKPVILTGSQIPLVEVRSDARENLIDALMVAGNQEIPVSEVGVMFGGLLLRGNRTTKVSADGLEAFASPNLAPLGRGGVRLRIFPERLRPAAAGPLRVEPLLPSHVGAIRLFPGMEAELLRSFLAPPLQGLVLEAFGVGNAPARPAFLEAVREATGRGVVIVVCTQCLEGRVDLTSYAAGAGLAAAGAISGQDMTAEAAMTKLFWLFGRGLEPADVGRAMQEDIRGELTLPVRRR